MSVAVPEAINSSFVAKARAGVTTVELAGETVLYDESSGRLHHLNPQGSVLWRWFDGSGPLADLAADVSAAYQADPAIVEADVVALARRLATEGLLEGMGDEHAGTGQDTEADTETAFLPEPPSP